MKFYDCSTAPSPRRIRMELAERGLLDKTGKVEVNLREKEQMSEAFRDINPLCTVPVLELDDGTRFWSTAGIRHYLEAAHPDPALLGRTAVEKGQIADLVWRIEIDGFMAVGEALRNSAPGMKGRAIIGPHGYEQIPELAERGRARVPRFMEWLDGVIGDRPFVAGDALSAADIDAFVVVEFAKWIKIEVPDGCRNLARWHAAMSARPSAQL